METYTPIQFNADVTLTCKREISIILCSEEYLDLKRCEGLLSISQCC